MDTDTAERVDRAFAGVDRAGFLPAEQRRFVGVDGALPIGYGQTNSQPRTVRDMLLLLDVRPGQRVLDVGSGSGWTTALLAELVGPEGAVAGTEIVPELVVWGRENLARTGFTWARIEQALPDVLGLPEAGPFDRVLVSAGATEVPQQLVDQLVVDGLMVVPVDGRMCVVRRTPGGAEVRRTGRYTFVPLIEPGTGA